MPDARSYASSQLTSRPETNLDGMYLLRCSDPHLPAEDIALGYKQLLEVERGWRDMKRPDEPRCRRPACSQVAADDG
jgi:hypothetical protein